MEKTVLRDIVLASGNAGKIREMTALLAPLGLQIHPQTRWEVSSCPETGLTFVENAILKARHAAQQTGLPALADDSGIEVDALRGQPGIYSARYAGPEADDAANNAKLLQALAGVPQVQRSARFRCVIVLLTHAEDPAPILAEGCWEGWITEQPAGGGGFGYDPLFFVPEQGCTAAELTAAVKNELSHRAQALRALSARLR